jgi:hypothetical protein
MLRRRNSSLVWAGGLTMFHLHPLRFLYFHGKHLQPASLVLAAKLLRFVCVAARRTSEPGSYRPYKHMSS